MSYDNNICLQFYMANIVFFSFSGMQFYVVMYLSLRDCKTRLTVDIYSRYFLGFKCFILLTDMRLLGMLNSRDLVLCLNNRI